MNNLSELHEATSVNVHDYRRAFLYKNTRQLRFTWLIFRILQKPWMVKALTNLTEWSLKNNLPVQGLIRNTIFKVFCAGETMPEAIKSIRKLTNYNVSAVLDYVSEGETTEEVFDYNRDVIVSNIRLLSKEAPGNAISVKLSGLEDPEWLEKVNNLSEEKMDTADAARYKNFFARVDAICGECKKARVIVYLDAEERCTQDVFDRISGLMMRKYNIENALVYNTVQMYLKDRAEYLAYLLHDSEQFSYKPGIKLVRGAYVEKERAAAAKKGLPDPIHKTKADTDEAFDRALHLCLRHSHRVYTCVASHNERSTLLAIKLIHTQDIDDHRSKVKFSQLYGMSDNLTFNLAARGYSASKYVPYGEVKKAIPYLIRRAEENTSIGGQLSKELTCIEGELRRRKKQIRTLFYT